MNSPANEPLGASQKRRCAAQRAAQIDRRRTCFDGDDCAEVGEEAIRGIRLSGRQGGVRPIARAAVGTENRVLRSHVDVDVGMIVRRGLADAFELPRSNPDLRQARSFLSLG